MKKVIAFVIVLCLVFVVVSCTYNEAKAEALSASLALGSTVVVGEAAAVLTVLAAAGIVAVTAVGAYVLYSYVKSKYADSYVYDSENNTITLKNADFINSLKNNNTVTVTQGNKLWMRDITFYADKLGTGAVYELCALPTLPTGVYRLFVEALVVGGDFTILSGVTPYNSNACISGMIDVGGYRWSKTDGVSISVQMNVLNDSAGYYINGNLVTNKLSIVDYIGSKYYSWGYPTCTGYGITKLKVSIEPAANVTATAGRDYALNSGKDIVGYIDKPIAVDVPQDGSIDLEKLKDLYYVPGLRDAAIDKPADTTIDLNPPTDVPTDRLQPPSLSIPEAITTRFPFSLPWDYYRLLQILDVEGEKYSYDFNLLGYHMSLNFDNFEKLILIFRKLLFLGFLFGMLNKTVVLLKGGDN
jgi:hypothetical protein